MNNEEKLLEYDTIVAAVAGETWAKEKVIAHYADYIEELSTVEIRTNDGKVKKQINEDLRQSIIIKLLEQISDFRLQE